MSIRVDTTTGPKIFSYLESKVFANDPVYIPSTQHLQENGRSFVAYESNTPVACCHAQLQTANPSVGTIGAFHALNIPAAAQVLLEKAVEWLHSQGARQILAPMDGDTWHSYRFNTGPYEEVPFIKEPWNPPYYPDLIEAAGFVVAEIYESHAADSAKAATNQKKFYDRCVKQGYTFNAITAADFADQLPVIYQLSLRIFPENVLYTPISEEEFIRMYLPARSLLQTGLSWLASDPAGIPVGYVFAFPDYTDALRAMKGRDSLSAKLSFLLNKRKASRACLKTLGVIPEKSGSGLAAALTYLSYKNSTDLGYPETLMCLMHSSNDSRRFGGKADRPFRTYALYEYQP